MAAWMMREIAALRDKNRRLTEELHREISSFRKRVYDLDRHVFETEEQLRDSERRQQEMEVERRRYRRRVQLLAAALIPFAFLTLWFVFLDASSIFGNVASDTEPKKVATESVIEEPQAITAANVNTFDGNQPEETIPNEPAVTNEFNPNASSEESPNFSGIWTTFWNIILLVAAALVALVISIGVIAFAIEYVSNVWRNHFSGRIENSFGILALFLSLTSTLLSTFRYWNDLSSNEAFSYVIFFAIALYVFLTVFFFSGSAILGFAVYLVISSFLSISSWLIGKGLSGPPKEFLEMIQNMNTPEASIMLLGVLLPALLVFVITLIQTVRLVRGARNHA